MSIPKILFAFLFISTAVFAQSEAFTYDMEGLHPNYLVVEMEGMSQSSLYKKALAWSKTGNRTVISSEDGKKVVFQGEKENAFFQNCPGGAARHHDVRQPSAGSGRRGRS